MKIHDAEEFIKNNLMKMEMFEKKTLLMKLLNRSKD